MTSHSLFYHLDRQVDHDVVEILPGEEVIVHFVFLSSVQLGERFRPTQYLCQHYNYVRKGAQKYLM